VSEEDRKRWILEQKRKAAGLTPEGVRTPTWAETLAGEDQQLVIGEEGGGMLRRAPRVAAGGGFMAGEFGGERLLGRPTTTIQKLPGAPARAYEPTVPGGPVSIEPAAPMALGPGARERAIAEMYPDITTPEEVLGMRKTGMSDAEVRAELGRRQADQEAEVERQTKIANIARALVSTGQAADLQEGAQFAEGGMRPRLLPEKKEPEEKPWKPMSRKEQLQWTRDLAEARRKPGVDVARLVSQTRAILGEYTNADEAVQEEMMEDATTRARAGDLSAKAFLDNVRRLEGGR
jgi:hypothetical protein